MLFTRAKYYNGTKSKKIKNKISHAHIQAHRSRIQLTQEMGKRTCQSDGKSSSYSIESALRVGKGLHVRVLRVRLLELLEEAVHHRRGLVLVSAAADQVDQRVGIVLALAQSLAKRNQRSTKHTHTAHTKAVRHISQVLQLGCSILPMITSQNNPDYSRHKMQNFRLLLEVGENMLNLNRESMHN